MILNKCKIFKESRVIKMKLAVCGNLQIGMQIKNLLKDTEYSITHFLNDGSASSVSQGGGY